MNQPSILVRVAGSPFAAIPLALGGMRLIFMWTQGRASVWFALIGFFVAVRTISSVRQRSRYKVWRKQWESVGTLGNSPTRRKKRGLRLATILASALFIGIIAFGPQVSDNQQVHNALVWVWLVCGVFLAARVVRGIVRLVMKRRNRNVETAQQEVAPVSCMLSRTFDSPSREMAVKSLPEYAARILSRTKLGVDNNSQVIH
jgi:hypothetical protein